MMSMHANQAVSSGLGVKSPYAIKRRQKNTRMPCGMVLGDIDWSSNPVRSAMLVRRAVGCWRACRVVGLPVESRKDLGE